MELLSMLLRPVVIPQRRQAALVESMDGYDRSVRNEGPRSYGDGCVYDAWRKVDDV